MQTANVNKKYNIHSRFCTGSLIMEKLKKQCVQPTSNKKHICWHRQGLVSFPYNDGFQCHRMCAYNSHHALAALTVDIPHIQYMTIPQYYTNNIAAKKSQKR